MNSAIPMSNGLYSLTLDNATAREHRSLVADSMESLPTQSVDYTADKVAIDAPIATETSLWLQQRDMEYALVRRLYTSDKTVAYKQLCVFAKRDNLHKRLVAIVMYTPQGNAWFDVTTSCRVTLRGKLKCRRVSNDMARQLVGADSDTNVYMQSFSEVLHEHAHRMQDKRRYHAAMKSAPRDRRVAPYIMPANYGQIVNERKAVEQVLEDAYLYRKWG